MTTKRYALTNVKAWKAAQSDSMGQFEAIVSVFGNIDLQGDRVMPGAFTKSIQSWKQSGDEVPVIWSHDWEDPFSIIGSVVDLAETDTGLWVRGQLDLENPKASQVYRLLKNRQVKEFSFAYNIVAEAPASDGATNLTELEIIEVGPTLKGANPETQLLAVKSAPTEEAAAPVEEPQSKPTFDLAGLQQLHDAIRGLGVVCSEPHEATDSEQPKVEEPEVVKTEQDEADLHSHYESIIEQLTP